jgi:hypothetical protein
LSADERNIWKTRTPSPPEKNQPPVVFELRRAISTVARFHNLAASYITGSASISTSSIAIKTTLPGAVLLVGGHKSAGFPDIEIHGVFGGLESYNSWREKQDYLLLLTASGSLVMNLSLELHEE